MEFGKIYDADWKLLADEQNLPPAKLDPAHNPLHAFYNTGGNLARLSDLNKNNPAVLDYLAGAYPQWIGQGADAFRIDTIGWMPDAFWKPVRRRIRAQRRLRVRREDFDYDADKIAHHLRLGRRGQRARLPAQGRPRRSVQFAARGVRTPVRAVAPGRRARTRIPTSSPSTTTTWRGWTPTTTASSTPTTGCSPRAASRPCTGSETGFERSHAEHMGNLASTSTRNAWTPPKA